MTDDNRRAWDVASEKYEREYAETLELARRGTLTERELELLAPVLEIGPLVVHPQSGNGTDGVALIAAGARSVIGVDFSPVAARAASRRADELGVPCRYVVAELPGVPLRDGCADLVYTGKGALIWMRSISEWATDVARLLKPGGTLFVYDRHPVAVLWSWDADETRIRADRDYFAATHVNDSFPGNGAVEWQWSLGETVTAVAAAGLTIELVEEYAEPFYRHGGFDARAWDGRLPNAFALVARRPAG